MNELLKFSNELAKNINSTNLSNLANNDTWKSPTQIQNEKVNEIEEKFLNSQKWANNLNQNNSTIIKKRVKRHKNGQNEIEMQQNIFSDTPKFFINLTPEWWEEIAYQIQEMTSEDFAKLFKNRIREDKWKEFSYIDHRVSDNRLLA